MERNSWNLLVCFSPPPKRKNNSEACLWVREGKGQPEKLLSVNYVK